MVASACTAESGGDAGASWHSDIAKAASATRNGMPRGILASSPPEADSPAPARRDARRDAAGDVGAHRAEICSARWRPMPREGKRISMKIASFNINNIRRRLPNLLDWLRGAKPDVVCLQELKCPDAEFPDGALRKAGYEAVWRGQKTWNGVAILARGATPVVTRTELPGDPDDRQSRYIEAAVNGVLIASFYAPNGNPQPGPKFDYKLAWFGRLIRHAGTLKKAGIPVALAGD